MMHRLKVPDALAGRRVEAHQAFREQIVPMPVPAIVIARRRAEGQVHVTQFVVGRHQRPYVCVAAIAPRLVLPGLDAEFALLRDAVETPLEGPRAHVVAPDVPGRVILEQRKIKDDGADDDRVADDHHRLVVADVSTVDLSAQTL